eukprot:4334580-Alexandrium_andersonii.AAC.1
MAAELPSLRIPGVHPGWIASASPLARSPSVFLRMANPAASTPSHAGTSSAGTSRPCRAPW